MAGPLSTHPHRTLLASCAPAGSERQASPQLHHTDSATTPDADLAAPRTRTRHPLHPRRRPVPGELSAASAPQQHTPHLSESQPAATPRTAPHLHSIHRGYAPSTLIRPLLDRPRRTRRVPRPTAVTWPDMRSQRESRSSRRKQPSRISTVQFSMLARTMYESVLSDDDKMFMRRRKMGVQLSPHDDSIVMLVIAYCWAMRYGNAERRAPSGGRRAAGAAQPHALPYAHADRAICSGIRGRRRSRRGCRVALLNCRARGHASEEGTREGITASAGRD